MNIFKSLSQGNGRISETNITSFLSYLLNSTNELDNSFLLLFFDLIDKNLPVNKLNDLLNLGNGTLRERVFNLSKNYAITAIPEYAVKKDSTKQIIDVFLKISTKNKKEETDIAYAIIENKIKPGAVNKEQAGKQFECFTGTDDYQKGLPVYSLILTSDFEIFSSMHAYALTVNPNSVWLKWTSQHDSENTIEAALRNLLVLEQHAQIQPINPNTEFILKSFIDYVVTEFSNSSTGERNFNFNGSDEVEKAEVKIDGKLHILRRYENKMVRIFDEHDNVLELEVLPLLRRINEEYKLSIERFHSKGTNPKNTQVFGKEVIGAINNLK